MFDILHPRILLQFIYLFLCFFQEQFQSFRPVFLIEKNKLHVLNKKRNLHVGMIKVQDSFDRFVKNFQKVDHNIRKHH